LTLATTKRYRDQVESTPLPVALRDRVEFASSEWIEVARAYLEPRVAAHTDSLRGVRFGVCEVYTDAPAHLGYPNNEAAFHICIDDGVLDIGRGEVDDVDMKVRADYERAHVAVTAVWEQMPERRTRILRELRHRTGVDAFEIKGALDPSSPAMPVLAGVHDHLARHTVTNPDIDRRVERLGLSRNVAQLDEQGYTVLENAISPQFADELKAALVALIESGPPPNLTAARLLARGELFEEVAVHPWVLTLAEHLVGRGRDAVELVGIHEGSRHRYPPAAHRLPVDPRAVPGVLHERHHDLCA